MGKLVHNCNRCYHLPKCLRTAIMCVTQYSERSNHKGLHIHFERGAWPKHSLNHIVIVRTTNGNVN